MSRASRARRAAERELLEQSMREIVGNLSGPTRQALLASPELAPYPDDRMGSSYWMTIVDRDGNEVTVPSMSIGPQERPTHLIVDDIDDRDPRDLSFSQADVDAAVERQQQVQLARFRNQFEGGFSGLYVVEPVYPPPSYVQANNDNGDFIDSSRMALMQQQTKNVRNIPVMFSSGKGHPALIAINELGEFWLIKHHEIHATKDVSNQQEDLYWVIKSIFTFNMFPVDAVAEQYSFNTLDARVSIEDFRVKECGGHLAVEISGILPAGVILGDLGPDIYYRSKAKEELALKDQHRKADFEFTKGRISN